MHISDEPEVIPGAPTHLDPIVDVLEQHGNAVEPGYPRWRVDQGGWYAQLVDPIDFALIEKHFELPETVKLFKEYDHIFCVKTWTYIRGGLYHGLISLLTQKQN